MRTRCSSKFEAMQKVSGICKSCVVLLWWESLKTPKEPNSADQSRVPSSYQGAASTGDLRSMDFFKWNNFRGTAGSHTSVSLHTIP